MKLYYLSEAQGRLVRAWWNDLQPKDANDSGPRLHAGLGRADRARLRRAASIEDLETERAAQILAAGLLEEPFKDDIGPLLLVAGVLAAVKEKQDVPDGHSLAWRLGQAAAKDGTPPMSELRFKRLLKARNLDEFFTVARRAVVLAKGKADVAVLADDLLAWAYEHRAQREQTPSQSLCFRWARDYYQPQKGKDASVTADESTDKETEEGERA